MPLHAITAVYGEEVRAPAGSRDHAANDASQQKIAGALQLAERLAASTNAGAGMRSAGRSIAAGRGGVAGRLAHAAADGTSGGLDGHGAVDHGGAGQPAGREVRVPLADGRAAVGADGHGAGLVAQRGAVKAIHDPASVAG